MDKIISLINEINTMAIRINSVGTHTVFYRYSGHVNAFEVNVYIGGWVTEANSDYEKTVWGLFELNSTDKSIKELEEIKENLYDLMNL